MKKRFFQRVRKIFVAFGVLLSLDAPRFLMAEPLPGAISAFNVYSQAVTDRLAQQHRSANAFLVVEASDPKGAERRLRQGELLIEPVKERGAAAGADFSGAMLHHWRGTAFAPGARAADFERLMRDFKSYPQHFSPQVMQAKVLTQNGDQVQAWMRVRQKHVITVVMDTTYDVMFGKTDAQHGYSISRSTRIAEVDSAGKADERVLNAKEEHGFLWRLDTYWSYEERDGGLYLQIEAVSLSRSIPRGLGWAVGPYVTSIPRESLEFTLRSASNALRRPSTQTVLNAERNQR